MFKVLLHFSLGLVMWYGNAVWPGSVLQNCQKLYSTLYNKVSVLCSKFWMWYRSVARVMEMVCSKLWYVVLQCLNHGAVWPGGNVVFKVFNSDALYCTTFPNIVPHCTTSPNSVARREMLCDKVINSAALKVLGSLLY